LPRWKNVEAAVLETDGRFSVIPSAPGGRAAVWAVREYSLTRSKIATDVSAITAESCSSTAQQAVQAAILAESPAFWQASEARRANLFPQPVLVADRRELSVSVHEMCGA
jgi:hypothetical protein